MKRHVVEHVVRDDGQVPPAEVGEQGRDELVVERPQVAPGVALEDLSKPLDVGPAAAG